MEINKKIEDGKKEKIKRVVANLKEKVKQEENTIIFFNNICGYIENLSLDNRSGYICCYKTSNGEHENYNVDPVFYPGFIDLELFHKLCYKNGILLTMMYDEEENNAYMYFEYGKTVDLNSFDTDLITANLQKMNKFYQYLIDFNIPMLKNVEQKNAKNNIN